MISQVGPFNAQVYEGAFCSQPVQGNLERNFPSVLANAPGGLVAAPAGTIQGRFGWASATGIVNNTRVDATDVLGVVIPLQRLGPTWQFYDPVVNAWRIRGGINLTLMAQGDFWLRFAGGAYTGTPVYASLVDGSAISGETDGAELTRWLVCSNAAPGCLAKVSSYATFGG